MDRNDLEDILGFDGLEIFFSGTGLFLLSGALWLGIEKILEQEAFSLTILLVVCAASIILGAVFFVVGMLMRKKKRSRIQRIFDETEEENPSGEVHAGA